MFSNDLLDISDLLDIKQKLFHEPIPTTRTYVELLKYNKPLNQFKNTQDEITKTNYEKNKKIQNIAIAKRMLAQESEDYYLIKEINWREQWSESKINCKEDKRNKISCCYFTPESFY
ncbi:MAG: hypothetical protein ACLFN8_04850 [Candidatus Woesearchaeota archaeon]